MHVTICSTLINEWNKKNKCTVLFGDHTKSSKMCTTTYINTIIKMLSKLVQNIVKNNYKMHVNCIQFFAKNVSCSSSISNK